MEDRLQKEIEELLDKNKENRDAGTLVQNDLKNSQGVLQTLIRAVIDDDNYRQILLLAAFQDKQEAILCSEAIAERRRYGVSIESIMDRVICQCAINSARVEQALRGITHTSFYTNYRGEGKKPDKNEERPSS